ncbi:MAG: hypothetical protein LLG04_10630 [Parachlamydia sp.]|nr:hypothetical protein [Parachlamydia sp.]
MSRLNITLFLVVLQGKISRVLVEIQGKNEFIWSKFKVKMNLFGQNARVYVNLDAPPKGF